MRAPESVTSYPTAAYVVGVPPAGAVLQDSPRLCLRGPAWSGGVLRRTTEGSVTAFLPLFSAARVRWADCLMRTAVRLFGVFSAIPRYPTFVPLTSSVFGCFARRLLGIRDIVTSATMLWYERGGTGVRVGLDPERAAARLADCERLIEEAQRLEAEAGTLRARAAMVARTWRLDLPGATLDNPASGR